MAAAVVYTNFGGMLVHENRGGTETEYVNDTLGSLVECRNTSGTKTYDATYWPYGEIRTSTGTNPSPWAFVGLLGYLRETSARTYVRARYLRVELARWMSVDPLWPDEEPFLYVDDQPGFVTDQSGQQGQGCTGQNYLYCEAKCALLGGVKRCVQNSRSKKLLFCTCRNKPIPPGSGSVLDKLKRLLKLARLGSALCKAVCLGFLADCIVAAWRGDFKEAACTCYEAYKEEGHSGNWLQDKLFDFTCGGIMHALQLWCTGRIDFDAGLDG